MENSKRTMVAREKKAIQIIILQSHTYLQQKNVSDFNSTVEKHSILHCENENLIK
jgi:hypothetical protein